MRPAQAQRVNTLASGRPLGYGEYKDCARPLRRLLKQYGSGSLEGGLRFAQTNGDAQAELVALLNVDRPVRTLGKITTKTSFFEGMTTLRVCFGR